MDIFDFTEMLSDKSADSLKKLRYKYPEQFGDYLAALRALYWKELPLADFAGAPLCLMPARLETRLDMAKPLMRPQTSQYGVKAAEDEISASSSIEGIDFSRDSIRRIFSGYAPKDREEDRILGQKRGIDFIADPANTITEASIHTLYELMVGAYLPEEERLLPGHFYRHDSVHVVGERIEHTGIAHALLPERMGGLVSFIRTEDGMDDMVKAAVVHFYLAYLHPYFDGNGRMARMLHLWYLVQRGYPSALFVPFSGSILKNRGGYYKAYSLIEENAAISGIVDVTPFVRFFYEYVYSRFSAGQIGQDTLAGYREAVEGRRVTPREAELWAFVLSRYGREEFSTKQLERDSGMAAYATIRAFVRKFTALGLLSETKYGPRNRYRVI